MKTTSEFISQEEDKPLQKINEFEGMQQKLLKSKHGKKEE